MCSNLEKTAAAYAKTAPSTTLACNATQASSVEQLDQQSKRLRDSNFFSPLAKSLLSGP